MLFLQIMIYYHLLSIFVLKFFAKNIFLFGLKSAYLI